MSDIYKPDQLQEDALSKKLALDIAVDTQVILQLLVSKGIITKEEVDEMRNKVKSLPKYKASYEVVEGLEKASDLYKNNPEDYLKMLFDAKLKGK